MAKGETLEGLRVRKLGRHSTCKNPLTVPMKSMDGEVFRICADDLQDTDLRIGDLIGEAAVPSRPVEDRPEPRLQLVENRPEPDPPVKRKRGRPPLPPGVKGKTPKMEVRLPAGASSEEQRFQCSFDTVRWVKVRRFKRKPFFGSKANRGAVEYRCRCGTEGNKNYLPNEVCEKYAGPKPK